MKHFNFIVNRICANTPPCCSKRASRFVWVLVLMLTLGVGQMWGADGDTAYELTFTKLTSGTNISSYTAAHDLTVSSKNWSVVGNQSLGAYLGVGGKNIEDEDRTLTCTSSIDKVIKEVKVNYSGIVDGTGITLTVNSAKLEVSSNSSFSSIIETVNVNNLNLIAGCSASHISFTPSGSPWASGKYYRISINCTTVTTSGTKNSHFDITSVQFIEGSTATLSSIAITTQPNTLAYLIGETFSPEGAVVTATMSNSTTKTVTATWTPNTAFTTTGSKTITASYTESAVNKTATTTANVFSVTVQVVDEDGTPLSGVGMPTASATGKNITASAKGNNYVFKTWEFVGSNNGLSFGTATNRETTLSGTPTGNVTIKAVYHKPIAVTWKVNGKAWTPSAKSGVDGTAEVGYGEQVSTLPTEPTTAEFCGQKFMGWTKTEIGSTGLTDADEISDLNLFTTAGGSPEITTETTFHAVFADYAE